MKTIILALIMTCTSAQQLPTDWYTEDGNEKNNANLSELALYMDKILSVQKDVLIQSHKDIQKDMGEWKFAGQKTDLAVSKSGLFGFSAVKGTSAIELSWSKVDTNKSEEPNDSVVELNSEMNESDVLATVRPFYKVLLKNNRANEFSHNSRNFEDHVLRYHRALKQVSKLNDTQYVADKFQLDMSVSYSSPLFGLTRLSGDTRMRLEWKIIPSSLKSDNDDQEVVRKILEDVSIALENATPKEGYKLKKISIGLGLSKKNLLSFTKIKGDIAGSLFLKKTKAKLNIESDFSDEDYQWLNEEENKFLPLFKRSKFRKGIEKSFEMTNWFSKQFKKQQSQWEIGKFKTSYTISYSGFFGLANTSSNSSVSFEFSK